MIALDLPLDDLVSFEDNPRTISEERLAALAESLRAFGVYSPLVVRPHPDGRRWQVLAGNARLRALLRLREAGEPIERVSCVEFQGDEVAARLLLVRDNQHDGEWAWDRLHGFLADYGKESLASLAALTGFDERTVDDLLALATLPEAPGSGPVDPLLAGTDPETGATVDPTHAAAPREPVDPSYRPDAAPAATTRFVVGAIRGRIPLHVHGDLLTAFERISTEIGQTDVGSVLDRALDLLDPEHRP